MSAVPTGWRWRQGPIDPAPCAVFDIDGVISDANHRQHYLTGPRRDWEGFFAACVDDVPIPSNVALLEAIDLRLPVVLLTARPEWVREPTLGWLQAHGIRWDLLVMRPDRDFRTSPDFKRDALGQLLDVGFDVRVAVDDDIRIIEMYHGEQVPAVYIHSGYYE